MSDNNNIDFSTVLASSVHDMKNSLAMLLGTISDITNECSPKSCPVHSKFHRMQHEAQRVNRDLVLLLTMYKMDEGQYYFNLEEVNLHEYLEEIILEYKELLKNYNIKIQLECSSELIGYFDRSLVASIIKTIISNAYQYTTDKITITADIDKQYTKISILDNGPGYPKKMIFDRMPASTNVNFGSGSTGLGLYFSSRVAQLHKSKGKTGFIQLNNDNKGEGGIFSIYLP